MSTALVLVPAGQRPGALACYRLWLAAQAFQRFARQIADVITPVIQAVGDVIRRALAVFAPTIREHRRAQRARLARMHRQYRRKQRGWR